MEHLEEDDLQQRAKDVFNNLLLLNEESKLSLPPLDSDTERWMILWTHVLEEFVIRFGAYPAGFTSGWMKQVRIPDPRSSIATRAARAVKSTDLPQGEYFFKYGKSKYLRNALEQGIIRISPASSYNDPSLNPAIRDEEMELSICPWPPEITMKAYDGMTGECKGEIRPKNLVYTSRSRTNYYVYCLSLSFAPRLFFDFDADSCLVIRNPADFQEMILSIFENKMQGWTGGGEKIVYIDPLNCPIVDVAIFTSKHFRYAYQREYRFVWLPYHPKQILDQVLIEVPRIREYCYLVDLSVM